MSLQLLDSVAIAAIVAKEFEDHVLEVRWETGAVDLLEIGFNLTSQEQVVEVLFLAGLLEWENALNDNEDDDSDGEKVNLSAVICFPLLDFWGHIGHCATVTFELVNTLVASKAKISDFQV